MTKATMDVDGAVDHVMAALDGDIVMAMPLGLGKPVQFANALYRRVKKTPEARLTIVTALSLGKPQGRSDLEKRFLNPFLERVFGDYENLDFAADVAKDTLPDNITVHEFFFKPGSAMHRKAAQQNYISTNYTYAVRDALGLGVNLWAQMGAPGPNGDMSRVSFSCNPELTIEALEMLQVQREQGRKVATVVQFHPDLPYMGGDAEFSADSFDAVIDDEQTHKTIFSTPNMPVAMLDHFAGLNASALVPDGGTLQIGIGALGDAIVYSTIFKHQQNELYRGALADLGTSENCAQLIEEYGSLTPYEQGIYGCSEMFINGFVKLIDAGIVKRPVFADKEIQRQVNAGEIDPATLDGGIIMHGGFFIGPADFYQALRDMPDDLAKRISMTRIKFVNDLSGDFELKALQRQKARFVNTVFNVNLLGSAASDQLENGQVISGVGGQYNFVAQAHELSDARSILMLRSNRTRENETLSNVVWNYGHCTIPRHLRDIFVTEYGIADLRGKPDQEVIKQLLSVTDSRFQEGLRETAVTAGKLPADYRIPERFTHNTPERLTQIYTDYRKKGVFPDFPFGCDFTYEEEELARALGWLKERAKPRALLQIARTSFTQDQGADRFVTHLDRMGLENPQNWREKLYQRLLLVALDTCDKERV